MKKYLTKVPFALLMLMMLMSSFMYITDAGSVVQEYTTMGFPTRVMYFNLTAKILGILALLIPSVPQTIKTFAWAGFLYIFLLALFAHIMIDDGEFGGSAIALILRSGAAFFHFRKT